MVSAPPVPRRKGRKGQIYVLADVEGRWPSETAEEIRAAVADYFYDDTSGSLTSALVRAIQMVNQDLFEENERAIRADRQYATVCCVVLRGDDAYFALAGRALSYLIRSDAGERFGRGDPRPGERPASLIGQSEDVDVALHHRSLQQPGTIILGSSGLLDLIGDRVEDAPRGRPDRVVDAIRAIGREHRGKRSFRVLVIVPEGDDDAESSSEQFSDVWNQRLATPFGSAPTSRGGDGDAGRTGSRKQGRWLADLGGSLDAARVAIATPRFRPSTGPSERRSLDRPRRVAAPDEPLLVDQLSASRSPWSAAASLRSGPEPRIWAGPRVMPPGESPRHGNEQATRIDSRDQAPSDAFDDDVLDDRGSWLSNLLAVWDSTPRLILVLALALALFFAGYVGVLIAARILQGGAPYTTAMSNLTQAQQRESEALGQSDALVRRHLLAEADQLAQQALAAQPDNPLTITTSARIQREYRAASGIVDLPLPTPIVGLPAAADQMIVNGTDLYVLDRTNSRLYRFLLGADGITARSGSNPILVQQGDHIGSATVGNLTRIAWIPAGNARPNGALVALDSAGFLIQYEPVHGLSILSLRDPGSWANVTAIGALADDLVALNATQQTLTSFPAQSGSFDGPVYNYFAPDVSVNLSDAIDIAVDGDLYLLHANGQIQRFTDGKPSEYSNPPSDVLPGHPTGFALGQKAIFIGDAEHARIVQLSRTGAYQRQLTERDGTTILSQMRALALSDDQNALYVLSNDKIYRYSLPELRQ